jgi:undecaprenyl diphosphate synthase
MYSIEQLTSNNTAINLNIAIDYSGTYDIVQAVNKVIATNPNAPITEDDFSKYLLLYPDPNPDLFIRTSGESRISNFLLWQISYSECYFTEKLWPDFNKKALDIAIQWFNSRERRFGMISEQIQGVL